MNILSLFDGMSCGYLALQKAGIPIDRYDAYEIDKYALQASKHNFPDIVQHGNVFKADFSIHKDVDILMGGSPCTYWSIAQKNNRETEASGMGWELFSQYVRALHEVKPKFFVYENNKSMSEAIRKSISDTFGFEPILINSALVSAQNRQRLYWVGKLNGDGKYTKVNIEQPEDKGILLKDVLDGVTDREKGRAIIGSIGRTTTREYFKKSQGTMVFESVKTIKNAEPYNQNNANYPIYIGEIPEHNGKYRNGNQCSLQYRVYSIGGKSICCSSNSRNNIAIPVELRGDIPTKAISGTDGKTYTVYEVKNNQITIKDKTYPIKLNDGFYIIRKLTVEECKRLQTVPEWYDFSVISDTQAYKCLGNGWTIDVIAHLLSYCK